MHKRCLMIRNPLVGAYFTRLKPFQSELVDWSKPEYLNKIGQWALANNGWIWNADPLVDFAGPNSKSYLLREVIPWGDCVKLRYGASEVNHL